MTRITIDIDDGKTQSSVEPQSAIGNSPVSSSAPSGASTPPPVGGDVGGQGQALAAASADGALDGGPAPTSVSPGSGSISNSAAVPIAMQATLGDARSAGPAPTFE